jgi:hypothetical protein
MKETIEKKLICCIGDGAGFLCDILEEGKKEIRPKGSIKIKDPSGESQTPTLLN